MSYVVTAPLVISKDSTGTCRHLYTGAVLPEDNDPTQLEQLLEQGMVAEVEDESADKPAAKKAASTKDA